MAEDAKVQDGATGTQTSQDTAKQPETPAQAVTPQIDATELASLREKATKYDEIAPWTPAVATLQKRGVRPMDVMAGYSPQAQADQPKAEPKSNASEDTAALVRSVMSEQFAVQQHTIEAKAEGRVVSEIESEIDKLQVADAVKPILKDALYRRVQESRAKSFYPTGHPLASKYYAPLGEASVGELRKWANEQAAKLGAKALMNAGRSAIAARTVGGQAAPSGSPNGTGKDGTQPRGGRPAREDALESMRQIRLQLAGDNTSALAG